MTEKEIKEEQEKTDIICDKIHNQFKIAFYTTKDKNVLENVLNDLCNKENIQAEDYIWNMGYTDLQQYLTDLTE